MAERLEGTVALVTGASSGIGEATARRLAAEGATVVAVARRKDRLGDLVAEIAAAGGRAMAIGSDVTAPGQADAVVGEVVRTYGRLDTLVNNAGVMLVGPAEGAPIEEWDRMVSLNVSAVLAFSHAALPHLLTAAAEGGRQVADLVTISSVAGRVPRAGAAVYNLTKSGIGAFSEALRQEVAERHVRVSVVEPGAVDTELGDHINPRAKGAFEARIAGVERLAATDIADAVGYIVTSPRRVAINEILIRPTEQVA